VTGDDGRRRRFDALFEAHRVDIASYCSWRTDSRSDAEDAAAEVFLVAWRKIDTVPTGDAARVWLYATARRVTANQRRSRRRRAALADRLAQEHMLDASRPAAPTTEGEEATVHAALARLGERDREVLLLVEWEGLRPAELATVLGCREGTARGRLHRARRRFRDAFDETPRQEGPRRVARPATTPPPPPSPQPPPRTAGPPTASGRRPGTPEPARVVHLTSRTAMRKAQP
jgi:RNA polymerase sigma factor (sigma-70 family)